MGNHQAESKPVREPWLPPSLARLLLCQLSPSSSRPPPLGVLKDGSALVPAGVRGTVCRRDSHGSRPPSKPQTPSCPLGLDANSGKETIRVSRANQPSVAPRFQSSWLTEPSPSSTYQKGDHAQVRLPPLSASPAELVNVSASRWVNGKESACQYRRCKSMRVRSLGWEDPLKKEMATQSSILTWEIPWTEEPGWSHGVARSWTTEATKEQLQPGNYPPWTLGTQEWQELSATTLMTPTPHPHLCKHLRMPPVSRPIVSVFSPTCRRKKMK